MFSITTMASSTTKPVAMVSAMSVRLFTLKPARYITPNVPTIDSGTAAAGMMVAVALLRKMKITATTSPTASSSSICVSCTDARIVVVRSVRTCVSIDAGSVAVSVGRIFFTLSTTWITLAPGCLRTFTMMAGVSSIHAASRAFSAPSMTCAMSLRWTGAPFLYETMMLRYSSALLSWSLASMVYARCGPSKLPLAWLVFELETAVRMSSSEIEAEAAARGFTWIRTAGRWPPESETWPTPGTCEILVARRVSTRFCTCVIGIVCEVMPSVRIGASAGFTLL